MLASEEDRICAAWNDRLSDPAQLAGKRMAPRSTSVVRLALQDVVRILQDEPPLSHTYAAADAVGRLEPQPHWHINLNQALEVLLTGEVVVRAWTVAYLDATEREQLVMFEIINQAFHQLLRLHLRHYCEQCHTAVIADD